MSWLLQADSSLIIEAIAELPREVVVQRFEAVPLEVEISKRCCGVKLIQSTL